MSRVWLGRPGVWVAHLAPFSNTITGTSVSVLVNGSSVFTDFKFGKTSDTYLDIPAAVPLKIEFVPTGGTIPVLSTTVTLTETEYTISAIGNGTSEFLKLDILALNDDNATPAAGKGRLRVVHVAPFSNFPIVTAVDILVDGSKVLSSFGYRSISPYLELPAGIRDVEVQAFGGTTVITDTLILTDGVVLTVFAIGDVTNQPVQVLPIVNRQYLDREYLPLVVKS